MNNASSSLGRLGVRLLERWNRLEPADRRALGLGALVLVPALLFARVVLPIVGGVTEARAAVVDERRLLARELALLGQAERYPDALSDADARLRKGAERLFAGPDDYAAAAALASYVGDAARRSRVVVEQVEARDGSTPGDGLVTLTVELRARGDLQGVLELLRRLERGPRLVRVEELSVQRLGAAPVAGEGDDGSARDLVFVATVRGYAAARQVAVAGADGHNGGAP